MMNGPMMACLKTNRRRKVLFGVLYYSACGLVTAGTTVLPFADAMAQNDKHSCTIMVDNTPGTMRQNADSTVLASTQAGGQAARAQIIATNSSYRASVDAPSGFSVFPDQGNNNTSFSASFSASGATEFLSTPNSVEKKIKKGVSNIKINMSARRLSGSFPAGNYSATVTLRCE